MDLADIFHSTMYTYYGKSKFNPLDIKKSIKCRYSKEFSLFPLLTPDVIADRWLFVLFPIVKYQSNYFKIFHISHDLTFASVH